MKGESQVIWIIVFLIMALIILVIMTSTIMKGKDTADVTYSQVDLINCCDNCRARSTFSPSIQCPTGQGSVSLGELFESQGYTDYDSCDDIPFCG